MESPRVDLALAGTPRFLALETGLRFSEMLGLSLGCVRARGAFVRRFGARGGNLTAVASV